MILLNDLSLCVHSAFAKSLIKPNKKKKGFLTKGEMFVTPIASSMRRAEAHCWDWLATNNAGPNFWNCYLFCVCKFNYYIRHGNKVLGSFCSVWIWEKKKKNTQRDKGNSHTKLKLGEDTHLQLKFLGFCSCLFPFPLSHAAAEIFV